MLVDSIDINKFKFRFWGKYPIFLQTSDIHILTNHKKK